MKPATHKVHPSVPYADEIALLGGKAVVGKEPSSPYEVHDLVEHGLPARAALRLLEHFPAPPEAALITALGLTPRTLARRRADPTFQPASFRAMPAFQSNSSCSTRRALPRSLVSSESRPTISRASSPAAAIRSRCTAMSAKT